MQRTLPSQGTHVFYEQWRQILDYSDAVLDTGHQETIQDTRNTSGCILPSFFSARKTPGMHFVHLYVPHDIIAAKMTPSIGRMHPQLYCIKFGSKSDQWFLRYKHFCVLPPVFPDLPIIRPSSI